MGRWLCRMSARRMRGSGHPSVATVALVLVAAASPAAALAADAPVANTFDLSRLEGDDVTAAGADERFTGAEDDSRTGGAVAFAGDLDGDGHQDYAIASAGAEGRRGAVTVVYGPPATGRATDLAETGSRVSRIVGPHPGAQAGWSVAGVGDVNGDGRDDLLVGAPSADVPGRKAAGAAFLVFGGPRPALGRLSLGELGSAGVRIIGAAGFDFAGASVARTGDLDGDRRSELVVGASKAGGLGRRSAGAAFLLYSGSLTGDVDLASLGQRGYRIDGAAAGDDAGSAVSGVGDMNGDGRAEVVIGAPSAQAQSGTVHVVWGQPPAAAAPVDLAVLGDGGFTITGAGGERAGLAVAGLGDAIGDGRPDIAIGAPMSGWNGRARSGAVYIVPGRAESGSAAAPSGGLRVGGADPNERLGTAVAAAGDVDGDARADVLIGVSNDSALGRKGAGSVILLLPGRAASSGDLDAGSLAYSGFRFAGPDERAASASVAGGVDGDDDRRPDVLIGHPLQSDRRGGASLVLLPRLPNMPATPPLTDEVIATNVEVILDDSGSMRVYDPDGVLRRQALELMLTSPANRERVIGALEFASFAHQLVPPVLVGEAKIEQDRLEVLRRLLDERIKNGGKTNFEAAFISAAAANPDAQARIFVTDGGDSQSLSDFKGVRTYVIGVGPATGSGRTRLEGLAKASGGDFYPARNGGEVQAALAAIDARLRKERPLAASVEESSEAREVEGSVPGEAAAAVTGADADVKFEATAPQARLREVRVARMVTTWDRASSRFKLAGLRLRLGAARVWVSRNRLRRALRGEWQAVGLRNLEIRGRMGRTFLTLDVRGFHRRGSGRRAQAAGFGFGVVTRLSRSRGSKRTVARSRWTYQRRPS